MKSFQQEEISSQRRKIVLRTARTGDAKDYVYQCFPNIGQKKERRQKEQELMNQIDMVKDGTSIITIVRRSDLKFIGFIYTKSLDPYRSSIEVEDMVIPMQANRRKFAVDALKQFVKVVAEEKLAEKVIFKECYETIETEKYIRDFLHHYDINELMASSTS